MKLWFSFLKWINFILVALLFASCISPYLHPRLGYIVPILGVTFPYLLMAHLIMLLIWALYLHYRVYISLISLLLAWPWINNWVQVVPVFPKQSEDDIVLMSYNIHHFSGASSSSDYKDLEDEKKGFEKMVRGGNGLDIFCVQEYGSHSIAHFPFVDALKHQFRCGSRGQAIFSRYPLVDAGCLSFDNRVNGALYADIQLPDNDIVRVYNIHLQSNRISDLTAPFLDRDPMEVERVVQNTRSIMGRYIRSANQRVKQMEEILSHMEQSPYPVIICGDFNEVPQSWVYRKTAGKLKDAFQEAGWGWSSTYAGKLPFLRIDHIFLDAQFEVRNYQVGALKLSDHYPVTAVFAKK